MNITLIILLTAAFTAALFGVVPLLRKWMPKRFNGLDPFCFETSVELAGKSNGSQDIDVFAVSMRGRILCPADNCQTNVQVELCDVTDGTGNPEAVLCTDAAMRKAEAPEFFFRAYNGVIPGRNAILTRWRTVLELGCDLLRFPHRGQRTLMFTTRVCDKATGAELTCAKTTLSYFVAAEEGYVEFQRRMEQILSAGLLVSRQLCGQSPKPSQTEMLDNWLKQCMNYSSAKLNIDPDKACDGQNSEQKLQKACEILRTRADSSFRYGLAEMCIRIAAEEKPVSRDKQDWLGKLAEAMDIPDDRFHAMYQKYLPLEAQDNPDPALMLGIDISLPADELQKRLTEEYRKWNARVNHPDAEVRQRADKMLSYLTELRSRLMAEIKS